MTPPELDRIAQMCSEFLREAGVLWVTFGMLEPFLDWTLHASTGARAIASALWLLAAGIGCFVMGIAIQLRIDGGLSAADLDTAD